MTREGREIKEAGVMVCIFLYTMAGARDGF